MERGRGEQSGGAVRSPGAFGGNQSSGLVNNQIQLAGSLVWGWGQLQRDGMSTQAGRRLGRRGMETDRFGHDLAVNKSESIK